MSVMIQVAVFDTKPYDRQFLQAAAEQLPIEWRFHDFRLSPATASTVQGARAASVFVNDQVDAACLRTMGDLGIRYLALRCAGYNNVDLASARTANIAITRVPAYSPHAVAEHAVGLLLTLNRKIHRAYNRVREHNFSLTGLVGFDVAGKTIGVIGTGKIGKIAAQIFRGFQAEVVAYDPFPSHPWAEQCGVIYSDLPALLGGSDVISLHLPLLPETFHLLNAKTIAHMKPGAILINTSRGKLIDTAALIAALKSGHLGGVALDVYEEEEGVFFEDFSDKMLLDDELSHLLTFPNVLITSHQAFLTREALGEIARVTVQNILRFARQQPFLEGTVL